MADYRSRPSEDYAFDHLGLTERDKIKSEDDLIQELSQFCTVPEGIFRHPKSQRIVSVEVKRIIGNSLPQDNNNGRRKILRREKITWPWHSSVRAALEKANDRTVTTYKVEEHHVVFVVPDCLSLKNYNRLVTHVQETVDNYFHVQSHPMKRNKVQIHIIRGPSELFDRF